MASASIDDIGGGKWRVRWRVKVAGKWASKEKVIHGAKTDAEALRLRVIASIDEKGFYDVAADAAKAAPPANLLAGMLAYINAQEADGEQRASTAKKLRLRAELVATAIHAHTGIPEDRPLPVTLLSRSLFDGLKPSLNSAGISVARTHLGLLYRAWGWMVGAPGDWPQVPPCPRSPTGYVPKPRAMGRTVAPTMAHADAAIRRLKVRLDAASRGTLDALVFALLARFTGLRLDQLLAIHVEDIDARNGWLRVRKGKSRREQADQRSVPLASHLLSEPAIRRWMGHLPASGRALRISPGVRMTLHKSWADATAAGEVPRHVWDPPNREQARPAHGFRAAYIGAMKDAKVDPDVWHFLCGHTEEMADTHYGRELLDNARAAVEGLPPVDWIGPKPAADNVVPLRAKS